MDGPTPEIRRQLLDAALQAASQHGLARLSMGDVARAAGLSRQTLYRYFPNKDALIAAVVDRETAELIDVVTAAAAAHDDPGEALEAALTATLSATRSHPLLDRLLQTEPEALLPLLTSGAGPVMGQVRSVVEVVIGARLEGIEAAALRRLADVVTRLLVSYAVSPPDDPPDVVARDVTTFLTHGALGAPVPGGTTP